MKSFIGRSQVNDLEKAIGQYVTYRSWLSRSNPDRVLYLAIDEEAYENLFRDISGQVLLEDNAIKVIIVHIPSEEILRWIN